MACIVYGDMTPEELNAEIDELRGKIKEVIMGGVVTRASGKGRLIEYSRANQGGLEGLLKLATRERARRAGEQIDGAIRAEMPDDY